MLFAMSVNNFRGCVGAQRFSRKRMLEIFWSDEKLYTFTIVILKTTFEALRFNTLEKKKRLSCDRIVALLFCLFSIYFSEWGGCWL